MKPQEVEQTTQTLGDISEGELDELLSCRVSFAFIVNGHVSDFIKYRKLIEENPEIKLVYQKCGIEKLYISKHPPGRD